MSKRLSCNNKGMDLVLLKVCELELKVKKPFTCTPGAEDSCIVPLKCCNQDMVKKQLLITEEADIRAVSRMDIQNKQDGFVSYFCTNQIGLSFHTKS